MADVTLSSLFASGIPAISASEVEPKTADSGIVTTLVFAGEDASGAGKTYSVSGKAVITKLSVSSATSGDTFWSLTCDGSVVARQLDTGAIGTTVTIYDVTSSSLGAGVGILCDAGFDLFIRTVVDTNITVNISYVELV